MEDKRFIEIMNDLQFGEEEARQITLRAENDQITYDILQEMAIRNLWTPLDVDENVEKAKKMRYFRDLYEHWSVWIRIELMRNQQMNDMGSEQIEQAVLERANQDFNKYCGFHLKIIEGIRDFSYDVKQNGAKGDVSNVKNLYLALSFREFNVSVDDLSVAPLVKFYDEKIAGTLIPLDSEYFGIYLNKAQEMIDARPVEFDGSEDVV